MRHGQGKADDDGDEIPWLSTGAVGLGLWGWNREGRLLTWVGARIVIKEVVMQVLGAAQNINLARRR